MNKKELILLNSAFLVEGAFEQQTDSIFQWIKDYCCSLNMSEEEIIKIFTSLNDDQVKNIKKTSDYMQYCRTKHYDMLTNNYTKSDNEEVIAVKGDSLLELFGVGEEGASLFSHQKRVAIFEMKANEGYVVPKFVLGVAYHNGIGVDKNEAKALKLLRQASNWGHVLSIIYLCSIDKSYRDNNKNFVYAVLDDTPYKELFYHIYDSDKDVSKSNEYEILKELFSNKAIEDNKYDYVYAKILFNKHITTQDKNALLNGSTRETVAKASVLPMCVKSGAIKFDETVFQNCVNEKEILKSLRNADIRVHDAYKPLCICTDSTYETKKYVDLIKTSYKKDKVEVIDLNKCSPYEFEASCNNVFVTSCSNGENNVVVIVCQGKSTPYEYT
ncbi:MAG: SEL1-like repeat protein [Clostridia bacterium]|nr:SEL1-like repeat protein [Clostridia bacterium]